MKELECNTYDTVDVHRGSSLYTYVELVTTKLSYKVHLLQCLKGIEIKVLGLNGLKRIEARK